MCAPDIPERGVSSFPTHQQGNTCIGNRGRILVSTLLDCTAYTPPGNIFTPLGLFLQKSSSVECLEVNGTTENYKDNVHTGLLVSSSTQTDNEDFEYLDMNFKYPLMTMFTKCKKILF